MKTDLLKFGKGNAKLSKEIYTFSLPAGYSCPGAKACLAKANKKTGRITDGAHQEFRCFAASQEWRSSIRASRHRNFDLLRACKSRAKMAQLIGASLPDDARKVRIHVSGDFFSADYFRAWCDVARARSECVFYAYTKSLNFWVANRGEIPTNLRLVASQGGEFDHLIDRHGLRSAKVVLSLQEAEILGLAIDHDDSHAYGSEESFALLIHGGQKAGSVAAKALSGLRIQGWTGYSVKA